MKVAKTERAISKGKADCLVLISKITGCFRHCLHWSSLFLSREKLLVLLSVLGVPQHWGTCAKRTHNTKCAWTCNKMVLSFSWRTRSHITAASSEHPARVRQAMKHRDWGEAGGEEALRQVFQLAGSSAFCMSSWGGSLRLLGLQSHLLNVQFKILPYVTWGTGAWEASQNAWQEEATVWLPVMTLLTRPTHPFKWLTCEQFCCSALERMGHQEFCHAVICNQQCNLGCVQTSLACQMSHHLVPSRTLQGHSSCTIFCHSSKAYSIFLSGGCLQHEFSGR